MLDSIQKRDKIFIIATDITKSHTAVMIKIPLRVLSTCLQPSLCALKHFLNVQTLQKNFQIACTQRAKTRASNLLGLAFQALKRRYTGKPIAYA